MPHQKPCRNNEGAGPSDSGELEVPNSLQHNVESVGLSARELGAYRVPQESGAADASISILDRITDGILAVDHDWRITYFNRAAEVGTGLSRFEVLRRNLWEVFPNAGNCRFHQECTGAMSSQVTVEFEEYFSPLQKWLKVSAYPSRDGLTLLFHDVTEQRRTIETLRQQAQIINEVHESVIATDLEGCVIYYNRGAECLWGYTAAEALGRHISFLYDPRDYPLLQHQLMAILQRDGQHEMKIGVHAKSGERRIAQLTLSALGGPWGHLRGCIGCALDITERHHAERELVQSEERFRAVFESAPVGMTTSMNGRLATVNKHFCAFLGYEPEELIGMSLFDVTADEDLAETHRLFDEIRRGQRTYVEWEKRFVHKDGRVVWGFLTAVVLNNEGAEPQQHVAMVQDITERKQHEIARRDLMHRLFIAEEQERRRVSRELHDQLGQDLAFLELQLKTLRRQDQLTLSALKRVQEMESTSQLLARKIRELAFDLRPETLDSSGLAPAAKRFLEQRTQGTNIDVSFLCHGIEHRHVPSEIQTTLFRVTQEAITNTLRHANASRLSVVIQGTSTHLSVIVEDNGRGFDLKVIECATVGSAALGLRIMQERLELINGSLKIESHPGGGTVVAVRVPMSATTTPSQQGG
jgi:PAS domain S-box-containing protein